METVAANYKARTQIGSSIQVVHEAMPLQVNQMIVWMMNHPEMARCMVPRWNELKADQKAFADHVEGSAKNHGLEV